MYRFLILFMFLTGTLGQITLNGTCNFDNLPAVRSLNVTGLAGNWYQIRRIRNLQECGACSTMSINATLTNSTSPIITISNKEVSERNLKYRSGNITLNNGFQGKFSINLPDITLDSMILATNYTDYAVLYSCNNFNNATKNVWAWVLSRKPKLTKNQKEFVTSIINSYDEIRNATWTSPDHSKKACDPNSSVTYKMSPVLILLTLFIVCKDIFVSKVL